MRYACVMLAGLVVPGTICTGQAAAQGYPGMAGPYARPPTVSPYLNLLRPGAAPGINYYGLVRPQQNFYQGIRSLQQQQNATAAEAGQEQQGDIVTGHRSGFMTQQRYFLNNYGARAPGFGGRGVGAGYRGGMTPGAGGGRPGMGSMGAGMGAGRMR